MGHLSESWSTPVINPSDLRNRREREKRRWKRNYTTQIPRSQSTPILPIDATEGERRMRWERNSERGRHICSKATQMHFNQLSGGKETLWGVPTSLRYP